VLIGPNSVRLLHRLGLAEAIDEAGGSASKRAS
jgi:hypothetical protein